MSIEIIQWLLVIGSSLVLFFLAPWAKSPANFFSATSREEKEPHFWLLTSSLVISWLFAKSIYNAANLGQSFGLTGGLAYATYYLSFGVAGVILYRMRIKGGFTSIHHFLQTKYGKAAVIIFSLLIAIRLFNEVWSNTMLIGEYFGERGNSNYFLAILVFTSLTLAYVLKGGLRSSLLTDLIQMIAFAVLLTVILGVILPASDMNSMEILQSGEWSMEGGLNLLFAALIQVFSYPFHDPVMTDRAFIAKPKTTLKSFLAAMFLGAICIILFSLLGVYGKIAAFDEPPTLAIGKQMGPAILLLVNFIMITSAASTLDSTFSSGAKLLVIDLGGNKPATVKRGRIVMIIVAIAGTVPIFFSPEILSATTVSGTMVIGLAPVFLFWNKSMPKASFYLPVIAGLIVGLWLAFGEIPTEYIPFEGKYGDLLWVNIWGSLICFGLFFLPVGFTWIKDRRTNKEIESE